MNPNLSAVLKYLSGAALYGLWSALVFTGHADPQPLIAAIGAGITALLGYHAVTNLQAVPVAKSLPALPTIPPKDAP
jgi:hypothetical protein